MGVIQIRDRSERLGNIGGVRPVDTDNGAARAAAMRTQAVRERGGADADAIGRVVGGLATAVPAAIGAYGTFRERQRREAEQEAERRRREAEQRAKEEEALREEQDRSAADLYVARYQQGMDAYDNGSVGQDGKRVPGAMELTPDNTGAWLNANVEYRDKFGEDLKDELGMSPRAMEIARKRLVGYNLSAQNRWANRAASLDQARRKANGVARENAATAALMNLDGTTDDASRMCWEEWKEAGENSLEIAGIPKDSDAAKEILRKRALDVLGRRLERRIADTADNVAGLTPDEVKIGFDQLAAELAEDNILATLVPDAKFRNGDGEEIADYMSEPLGKAPLTDFAKAAARDIDIASRKAVHEAEAREREENQAVLREFTEQELALRDVPQEKWADAYDEMGKDEALKKADPQRAMAYRDAAARMREAERAAKESALRHAERAARAARDAAVKQNEDGLARALATLDLLKMDGSLPQDAANEAQAAIWRKFRTLSLGNQLSPSFMRSFETRLSGQLSDQEANAMRKFYQAFGYNGEVNARGEIPTSDRKSDTSDYAAPRNPGDRHSENYFRIPAAELFVYGDTLLRTLRTLGPDMNREGVVEKEISRLKTDWGKRQYDKNRDATVRSVMDMQREARTRWEMAQPDKRSEEDGGR